VGDDEVTKIGTCYAKQSQCNLYVDANSCNEADNGIQFLLFVTIYCYFLLFIIITSIYYLLLLNIYYHYYYYF
jgi:hypothetical protein